jgi:hypothetical protein
MAVTAKFKVARKIPLGVSYDANTGQWSGGRGESNEPYGWEVELTPDYAQGRNAEWAEATPAGMIRLTIKNELAAQQFNAGEAFTITFEREED